MNFIDYRDLPNQNNLFLDYMYDFEKVKKYYNYDFRSETDIERSMLYAQNRNINRKRIIEILSQSEENRSDSKALNNIDLLIETNSTAIVTGQQLGFYSGPLYTIYKIISALKLSEIFSKKYPDSHFIPVFWLEGEDHDFQEINKVKIIDKENNFFTHEYQPGNKPSDPNFGATGYFIPDSSINEFNKGIFNTITQSEFTERVRYIFTEAYSENTSLQKAFCNLIRRLFPDSGLVFVNPNSREIKELLKPVFEKEIKEYPKTSELVINISAELEEIYHAQVKARPINLFIHHKRGRYLLEPNNEDYSLKGIRQRYTALEIEEMLQNSPEVFSPNVILRPVCQDLILPTLCYVAGPSEIAYFAQFKDVYKRYGLEMPIIYPRAGITIIENKIQKVLDKYKLHVQDFFTKYELLMTKVSEEISSIKIEDVFRNVSVHFNQQFKDISLATETIDKTLLGNLDKSTERIDSILEIFKGKLIEAQKRNNKVALEQLEKTLMNLFPKGNFQEREINIIYFLNKYSPDIIQKIYNLIDIESFNHQLLYI